MENWKKEVVEVFLNTSFKECVMYCTDEKIITSEQEKRIFMYYNSTDEGQHEVVINFFDDLGINDNEFEEISNNFQGDYNSNLK